MILFFLSYIALAYFILNGNRNGISFIGLIQCLIASLLNTNYKLNTSIVLLIIFQLVILISLKNKPTNYPENSIKNNLLQYQLIKYLYIFFFLIGIYHFQGKQNIFLSDDIEIARIELAEESTYYMRLTKTVLPFLSINLILNLHINKIKFIKYLNLSKNYLLLYLLYFIPFLYEGSKSGILTGFIILMSMFYYLNYKTQFLKKIKYLIISVICILLLLNFNTIKEYQFEIENFLDSRFLNDNAKSILVPINYVKQYGHYNEFMYNPFLIFFNSLVGNRSNLIFPSLGNYLESDFKNVNSFEILVPNFMEGYVFAGIIGSIFYIISNYFFLKISYKKMIENYQKNSLLNTSFFFMILIELQSIITRGKFSNSITSVLFTLITIYGLIYILNYSIKKLKIENYIFY